MAAMLRWTAVFVLWAPAAGVYVESKYANGTLTEALRHVMSGRRLQDCTQCAGIPDFNDPRFKQCNIYGDPHFLATDGTRVDFHEFGTYNYFSSASSCSTGFDLDGIQCQWRQGALSATVALGFTLDGNPVNIFDETITNPAPVTSSGSLTSPTGVTFVSANSCVRINVIRRDAGVGVWPEYYYDTQIRVFDETASGGSNNFDGICEKKTDPANGGGSSQLVSTPGPQFDQAETQAVCAYCARQGGAVIPGCDASLLPSPEPQECPNLNFDPDCTRPQDIANFPNNPDACIGAIGPFTDTGGNPIERSCEDYCESLGSTCLFSADAFYDVPVGDEQQCAITGTVEAVNCNNPEFRAICQCTKLVATLAPSTPGCAYMQPGYDCNQQQRTPIVTAINADTGGSTTEEEICVVRVDPPGSCAQYCEDRGATCYAVLSPLDPVSGTPPFTADQICDSGTVEPEQSFCNLVLTGEIICACTTPTPPPTRPPPETVCTGEGRIPTPEEAEAACRDALPDECETPERVEECILDYCQTADPDIIDQYVEECQRTPPPPPDTKCTTAISCTAPAIEAKDDTACTILGDGTNQCEDREFCCKVCADEATCTGGSIVKPGNVYCGGTGATSCTSEEFCCDDPASCTTVTCSDNDGIDNGQSTCSVPEGQTCPFEDCCDRVCTADCSDPSDNGRYFPKETQPVLCSSDAECASKAFCCEEAQNCATYLILLGNSCTGDRVPKEGATTTPIYCGAAACMETQCCSEACDNSVCDGQTPPQIPRDPNGFPCDDAVMGQECNNVAHCCGNAGLCEDFIDTLCAPAAWTPRDNPPPCAGADCQRPECCVEACEQNVCAADQYQDKVRATFPNDPFPCDSGNANQQCDDPVYCCDRVCFAGDCQAPRYALVDSPPVCGNTCTEAACCNEFCTTENSGCGMNTVVREGTQCPSVGGCTPAVCCQDVGDCSSPVFNCAGEGFPPKANPDRCAGVTCTAADCCQTDTCTINCASQNPLFQIKRPAPCEAGVNCQNFQNCCEQVLCDPTLCDPMNGKVAPTMDRNCVDPSRCMGTNCCDDDDHCCDDADTCGNPMNSNLCDETEPKDPADIPANCGSTQCTAEQCCKESRCVASTCVAAQGFILKSPPPFCDGAGCQSTDVCCDPLDTCVGKPASFCGGDPVRENPPPFCASTSCMPAECCQVDDCDAALDCGDDSKVLKPGPPSCVRDVPGAVDRCSESRCCVTAGRCVVQATAVCRDAGVPPKALNNFPPFCGATDCTAIECCQVGNCQSDFDGTCQRPNRIPVADPANTPCNNADSCNPAVNNANCCGEATCCRDARTCAEDDFMCEPLEYLPPDFFNVIKCHDIPCTAAECCRDKTCLDIDSSICDGNSKLPLNKPCGRTECSDPDFCCVDAGRCVDFVGDLCNADQPPKTPPNIPEFCSGEQCTASECCRVGDCGDNSPPGLCNFGNGRVLFPRPCNSDPTCQPGTTCCNDEQWCCQDAGLCREQAADLCRPVDMTPPKDIQNFPTFCQGAMCTKDECCQVGNCRDDPDLCDFDIGRIVNTLPCNPDPACQPTSPNCCNRESRCCENADRCDAPDQDVCEEAGLEKRTPAYTPPFCSSTDCKISECCKDEECMAGVCDVPGFAPKEGAKCGGMGCQDKAVCCEKVCQPSDCSDELLTPKPPPAGEDNIICHPTGCTAEQCCLPVCSEADCTTERPALKEGTTVCEATGCTAEQCCNLVCSQEDCTPQRPTLKEPEGTTVCAETGCTAEQCCLVAGMCTQEVCTPELPKLKAMAPSMCAGGTCTAEECCEAESCSPMVCPAGFVLKAMPGPCAGSCTKEQCCDLVPGSESMPGNAAQATAMGMESRGVSGMIGDWSTTLKNIKEAVVQPVAWVAGAAIAGLMTGAFVIYAAWSRYLRERREDTSVRALITDVDVEGAGHALE